MKLRNLKIRGVRNIPAKNEAELKIARKFTDSALKELKGFVKTIVFFGSGAKVFRPKEHSDIDILLVFDDLQDRINPDVIRSYLLISGKIARKTSSKIHLTHMPLTEFWDYVRKGDPIAVNIIREGIATYDPGFFQPIKALLRRGKVKPSRESISSYSVRAPFSINNADWHIMQAVMDLYWAVIDSAHAALMHHGHVPVSPDHVAEMIEKEFVGKKLLDKSYSKTMDQFFKLQQMIKRRRIREITGAEYENYYRQAEAFVEGMKRVIEKE